jgi:hypothetical protein
MRKTRAGRGAGWLKHDLGAKICGTRLGAYINGVMLGANENGVMLGANGNGVMLYATSAPRLRRRKDLGANETWRRAAV